MRGKTKSGRPSLPVPADSDKEVGARLQSIESLRRRLVDQGDFSFRILDVCLALLQDVLAEAHATRRLSWDGFVMPQLRAKGIDGSELDREFMLQVDPARDYAYAVAERIRESQEGGSELVNMTSANAQPSDLRPDCELRRHTGVPPAFLYTLLVPQRAQWIYSYRAAGRYVVSDESNYYQQYRHNDQSRYISSPHSKEQPRN